MIKIKWYDACSKELNKAEMTALKNMDGKELLEINTTYGKSIILPDVVVMITEESTDDNTDVTIIPRVWIISPKRLQTK